MSRVPRPARGITILLFTGALLASGVACSLVRDVDALSADYGASAVDAAPEAAAPDGGTGEGGVVSCGGLHGPAMVPVPGAGYCIDATEVTGDQYREFRAAVGEDAGGQVAECAWNDSYVPTYDTPGDVAVTFVDFCDARAFCTWAGKRLCGKIGGGAITGTGDTQAAEDAWFRACTGGDAKNVYPYGGAFELGRCNGGDDTKTEEARSVGAQPACQGAVAGVFDLSGNVREWTDACDPGPSKTRECLVRGGSFYDVAGTLSCANRQVYTAETRNSGVGFRCCSR
jgi:formylglycine-generating enzyme